MSYAMDKADMPHWSTANLPHDEGRSLRHESPMEPIDYLIRRVAERLIAVQKSERQVSLDATGSPDALRYIRTRRAMPSPPRLRAIAEELQTSDDYLLGRVDRSAPVQKPLTAAALLGDPDAVAREMVQAIDNRAQRNKALRQKYVELPDDVPVFSADIKFEVFGSGVDEGWSTSEGMVVQLGIGIDSVKRLPKLYAADHVYAIYMPGVSMSPIFEAGDAILVDGKRAPAAGDYVIAYLVDDPEQLPHLAWTCMLKRLVRSTAEWHEFEEFNPYRRFKASRDQINHMHRVYTLKDFLT